ncbi:MAG: amidohydrolase [Sphingomonadales bacterium]|nr:MAG: amidohydrolase [Sphingomonadales bacterium]
MAAMAQQIWKLAETGFHETRSSALLQRQLGNAGFRVTTGVAGMPTAFVASYRNGPGPVIAILAEFDALPGASQQASAERAPVPGQGAGHACGHNLLGAAATAAAIALKDWMAQSQIRGEVRVYGTPAEEGGSGKVYFVRDGAFADVDAVLHWHPGDRNSSAQQPSQANISGKFRFRGLAAHASAAPDKGRSALDGVEIMNVAVNYLREHVPDGTRIHYIVSNGGTAPNVVPDFAESYYYVRNPDGAVVRAVMARVAEAARGAAIASGTEVTFEATGGVYSILPNGVLGEVLRRNLVSVGGPQWSAEETAFAAAIARGLAAPGDFSSATRIDPPGVDAPSGASTDVADVSWVVPTAGVRIATWVPGTASHSWQATAASGSGIGIKGAHVAAGTLALSAAQLLFDPSLLADAKAELLRRRGPAFRYEPMIGDRKPPLDYRK